MIRLKSQIKSIIVLLMSVLKQKNPNMNPLNWFASYLTNSPNRFLIVLPLVYCLLIVEQFLVLYYLYVDHLPNISDQLQFYLLC